MDFWQRYRAIDARDSRFDGQFVTAVRSTGIYCRPSCPARTPKARNVVFFETSAAAHEAGFRACKRCLPEAVPGTPAWNLRSDVAGRAMRLIGDGVVDREGVGGLATRLGYSTRQLNRILGHELGAGPLALARASRAQTARTLLVSTELGIADVAFAAGFNSVRQFNDTISEVFALTPSEMRSAASSALSRSPLAMIPSAAHPSTAQSAVAAPPSAVQPSAVQPSAALTVTLPCREPIDAGIFAFLAARAIPGIEDAQTADSGDGGTAHYSRTLRLPHGEAAFRVNFKPAQAGSPLTAELRTTDLRDLQPLLSRIRRLFDLDADPVAVDDVLRGDPRLKSSVRRHPGIRVPGAVDPQELLIRAMVGQQISVPAARTALTRLAGSGSPATAGAALGAVSVAGPDINDGGSVEEADNSPEHVDAPLTRLFPTAAQIAEFGSELLRGPRRRTESVLAVAEGLASGRLDIGYGDELGSLRAKLLPVPGIGPWTVGYVAMRVLGAPDVFLANDAAVRNGARRLPFQESLSPEFEECSPWRSYATMHLWRAASGAVAAERS